MKTKISDTRWMLNAIRGLLTGVVSAPLIAIFANTIALAGEINQKNPSISLMLPLGALLIAFIYKTFGDKYKKATIYAIDEIHKSEEDRTNLAASQNSDDMISPFMGVCGYFTATLSHLLGASVGKEGVGVQIGLSVGNLISRIEHGLCRRIQNGEPYYLMAGASAAFAALFGSPISGVLFGLQFASPAITRLDAMMPCTIAAFTSVFLSKQLGIHILDIPSFDVLPLSPVNFLVAFLVAIIIGLFARYFCYSLRKFTEINSRLAKGNRYIASLIPSCAVLLLITIHYFVKGNFNYNGLSANLMYSAISGNIDVYTFILKALLVFLSIAAGFIGGEVVPLLVTGSALGYAIAVLFKLPIPAFAALGAVGMLSGGTNLPLVCFALGLELFDYSEPAILFMFVVTSYIVSGNEGIYLHQRQDFKN